jgi:predicted RNase H-like HicB family nuclease
MVCGPCLELGVVSQGRTVEEARQNLTEAVELYLESFGGDDVQPMLTQ